MAKPLPPRLAIQQLSHYRVHYRDLEQFLSKVYRLDEWDFRRAAGVTTEVPEFMVTGRLPDNSCPARIRRGQRTNDVQLILDVLCADQHIPAGRYEIDTRPRSTAIEDYERLLAKHRDPRHQECVRFRQQHQKDRPFIKRAAVLDLALLHGGDSGPSLSQESP